MLWCAAVRDLIAAGATIQSTSALTLVVQNLLAIKLLGSDLYGQAVALLALPLFLQGMLEPLATGVSIAARADAGAFIALVRRSWAQFAVFGVVGLGAVAFYVAVHDASLSYALAVACFFALTVLTTLLRGLALSALRYKVVARHSAAALLVSIASVPLIIAHGLIGYLLMMCLVQIAVLAVFLADADTRSEALRTSLERGSSASSLPYLRVYGSNLSARVGQLVLGPGMALIAATQYASSVIAEFKIFQIFASLLAYALPISSVLLQAHAASTSRGMGSISSANTRIVSFRLLVISIGALGLASMAAWLCYPFVATWLVGVESTGLTFANIAWAAPYYVGGLLLGGALLGLRKDVAVLRTNGFLLPCIVAVALVAGAHIGFVFGAVSYTLVYGYLCRSR
jgi:hypothetical protein